MNCSPILDEDRIVRFLWACLVSLRRADIATPKSPTIASMRSSGSKIGTVGQLGWRLEILDHWLKTFPFCQKLQDTFATLETFDAMYPSKKHIDKAFAEGRPLNTDHAWIERLATQLDTAGEPILKKLAAGGNDGDITKQFAELKGKNVTLEKILAAPELESVAQKLQAAWEKDLQRAGAPAAAVADVSEETRTQKKEPMMRNSLMRWTG